VKCGPAARKTGTGCTATVEQASWSGITSAKCDRNGRVVVTGRIWKSRRRRDRTKAPNARGACCLFAQPTVRRYVEDEVHWKPSDSRNACFPRDRGPDCTRGHERDIKGHDEDGDGYDEYDSGTRRELEGFPPSDLAPAG